MLNLTAPPPDDLLPETPGGFCWWYVDLVDETGDGAVVIWGFALPFLEPPVTAIAADHPFVNLAVYRQGVCTAYWLVEVDPADVEAIAGGWRIGGCRFTTNRGERIVVEGTLELPVPGGKAPVNAHLSVEGAAARGAPPAAGSHRWSPVLCAGTGTVEIEGEPPITGRAYHDRNVSDVPLGALGIREWAWGRVAEPDGDRVHYVLWPDAGEPMVLDVFLAKDGQVTWSEGQFSEAGSAGGSWGLALPRTLRLDAWTFESGPPVDDAPFYARFPLRTASGRGWGERVRPGSIGRWWMRPFVRMRVIAPTSESLFAPLFIGPRADRLDRLWRSWWPST